MGLYRMMCRSGVVPCWRRKSTLIWAVLILGAVTYFVYSRSHRHKPLSQIFMSQNEGEDESGEYPATEGFWEKHGGDELERNLGKIHFKTRYKHKQRHRQQEHKDEEEQEEEEEVKYDDKDDERVRDREGDRAREEMRRRGHGEVPVEREEEGRGNIQREEENERENVIRKQDIHKQVEEEEHEIEEKLQGKEDNEGYEEEHRHDPGEENDNQEEIEELADDKNDENDENPRVMDANPGIQEEPEEDKNAQEEEGKKRDEEERENARLEIIEALKKKKELAKKKQAAYVRKHAGVIDAPLPNKEILSSWPHERLEALFHNYLTIPQIPCGVYARVGKKTHGGWDFCQLPEYRPIQPCLMYSFGFESDFTFEDDAARRYGCETHYFDPLAPRYMDGKSRTSGVVLHRYGLSSDDGITPTGWVVKKLQTIKETLQHDRSIDILKVDIEENEWRALPEMLESGVMGKVKQFLLEVHVLAKARVGMSTSDYIKKLMILRDLYIEGFRIAKSSPDETKLLSMDKLYRPQNYEILFLKIGSN